MEAISSTIVTETTILLVLPAPGGMPTAVMACHRLLGVPGKERRKKINVVLFVA
jgi:hypothetical protein